MNATPQFDLAAIAALPDAERVAFLDSLDDETRDILFKWSHYYGKEPIAARSDLIRLARYLMPDPDRREDPDGTLYMVAPHHRLIAEAFEKILSGECLRLAISIPPQFGKSTLARAFLASHIGRFPWKHLLVGTYNQDFANEYGDDTRNILLSPEYGRVYPRLKLRQGSKAKDHFVTERGGKVSFLGRKGSGSGRPADGFLLDDLLKNRLEADSKTIRDECWDFVNGVVIARCHALTWLALIATRWSDDDVIARLTDPKNPYYREEVAKQWVVVNIPAELDDPAMARALNMKVGDALWADRFPLPLLHTAKAMDPVNYSALYMGRPTPPEGSFYKQSDLTTYDSPMQFPKRCMTYLTGDLAVSPERNADKSCVMIWGLDEHDVLWLHYDLYWDRKASDESVDEIIERGKRFSVLEAFFEKGQLDRAIGPFLEKRMQEREAYFSLTRLGTAGNKGVRSLSFRGRMRQGKVRLPAFAPWYSAAKEQMLKFTGSGDDKEDDFCDAAGLIGEALGDTVKASAPTNVVKFPKSGTWAWTKAKHDLERAHAKRLKAMAGM